MRTVYLNAVLLPGGRAALGDRDRGDHPLRRLPGDRRQDRDRVVVAFIGYLQLFFDPIQQISQLYTTYQQGMAALDKIFDLLDTEPDMVDAPGRDRPGAAARRDRARRRLVLLRARRRRRRAERARGGARAGRSRAIDLHVPAGQTVALVGETGRRQVDAGEAGRALLRPAARPGAGRRPRPARAELDGAARPARDRAPGGLPVLGHDPREHRLRPPRRRARRRSSRRPRAVGAGAFIDRLPDGLRHRGRRARRRSSRPASASWSRSRARCSPSRGS